MKFDMSKAWNDAVAMMSANREVLAIVAGIFFFLPGTVMTLVTPAFESAFSFDPQQMEALNAAMMEFYLGYWWLILIVMAAQLIGYLSLLALLRDTSNPTVGDAIKTGLTGVLPALAAYLIFTIAISLVFALLIGIATALDLPALAVIAALIAFVGVIYASVKVSLSAPVIAIERIYNPFKVLARSWKLTKGNSLRLFLFLMLIVVVYVVFSAIAGILVMALAAASEGAGHIAQAIVSGLTGAVVAVVFVAVLAAIHRQLAGPDAASVSQTFE